MCGAAFYSAGRGKGKNPRGGAGRGEGENPRGGAGRGRAKKRANQPIQKIYKSAKNIILHIIILIIKLKSKNRLSFCFIFNSMYYFAENIVCKNLALKILPVVKLIRSINPLVILEGFTLFE